MDTSSTCAVERSKFLVEYSQHRPLSAGTKPRSLINKVAYAAGLGDDSEPEWEGDAWVLEGWCDEPSVPEKATQASSKLLVKYLKNIPYTLPTTTTNSPMRRAVSAGPAGRPMLKAADARRRGEVAGKQSTRRANPIHVKRRLLPNLEVGDESDIEINHHPGGGPASAQHQAAVAGPEACPTPPSEKQPPSQHWSSTSAHVEQVASPLHSSLLGSHRKPPSGPSSPHRQPKRPSDHDESQIGPAYGQLAGTSISNSTHSHVPSSPVAATTHWPGSHAKQPAAAQHRHPAHACASTDTAAKAAVRTRVHQDLEALADRRQTLQRNGYAKSSPPPGDLASDHIDLQSTLQSSAIPAHPAALRRASPRRALAQASAEQADASKAHAAPRIPLSGGDRLGRRPSGPVHQISGFSDTWADGGLSGWDAEGAASLPAAVDSPMASRPPPGRARHSHPIPMLQQSGAGSGGVHQQVSKSGSAGSVEASCSGRQDDDAHDALETVATQRRSTTHATQQGAHMANTSLSSPGVAGSSSSTAPGSKDAVGNHQGRSLQHQIGSYRQVSSGPGAPAAGSSHLSGASRSEDLSQMQPQVLPPPGNLSLASAASSPPPRSIGVGATGGQSPTVPLLRRASSDNRGTALSSGLGKMAQIPSEVLKKWGGAPLDSLDEAMQQLKLVKGGPGRPTRLSETSVGGFEMGSASGKVLHSPTAGLALMPDRVGPGRGSGLLGPWT